MFTVDIELNVGVVDTHVVILQTFSQSMVVGVLFFYFIYTYLRVNSQTHS